MSAFEKFKNLHGMPQKCEKVSDEQLRLFTGKLPEILLEEWKEFGWCCYGDGLFWMVNPEDYEDVLEELFENPEGKFVFLRTAFGGLFYRDGSDNYFLDMLEQDTSLLFNRIDYVFEHTLCDEDYLESVILQPLFEEALEKFGQLDKDECYGVFPSPALGGEIIIENLEKVKLREYLAILTQT